MNLHHHLHRAALEHRTRRHFLRDCTTGLGALYLASLGRGFGAAAPDPSSPLLPAPPPFSPKVKRVIYLHMLGAPSTLDLFHYKPELAKYNGVDCPKEFLEGQRFAFIQEMAFRMQLTAPEVMDITREPESVREAYGTTPGKESFANNCLLARRLVENGTRFVQLFDWGWDSHGDSEKHAINLGFKRKCGEIDRPISALLTDLKQRGLLEDTLVVWSGEFGRTPMQENRDGLDNKFVNWIGRDHNPNSFTLWMAGAGVKPGLQYGETDPLGYQVTKNPVHVRDFHATLLHLLGIDPHKHSYPYQGLNQKLVGVKPARVIKDLLA